MKKIVRIPLFACILSLASLQGGIYEVGDTVTSLDQSVSFPVCYGDYSSNTLSLADFNGAENGGDYKVIHIDTAASW